MQEYNKIILSQIMSNILPINNNYRPKMLSMKQKTSLTTVLVIGILATLLGTLAFFKVPFLVGMGAGAYGLIGSGGGLIAIDFIAFCLIMVSRFEAVTADARRFSETNTNLQEDLNIANQRNSELQNEVSEVTNSNTNLRNELNIANQRNSEFQNELNKANERSIQIENQSGSQINEINTQFESIKNNLKIEMEKIITTEWEQANYQVIFNKEKHKLEIDNIENTFNQKLDSLKGVIYEVKKFSSEVVDENKLLKNEYEKLRKLVLAQVLENKIIN